MALLPEKLPAGLLVLTRLDYEHTDELVVAAQSSFAELHEWMTWAEQMPTREGVAGFVHAAQRLFDDDLAWAFVMIETNSGELVGSCDVRVVSGTTCVEVGYWVRSDRTRRGYASAAATALTEAALHYLNVERVIIRMDQGNIASARIPAKIGYRLLGDEARTIETPGHTGTGWIWARDRQS